MIAEVLPLSTWSAEMVDGIVRMWDLVGGGKPNAIMSDPRQKLPSRMRPNRPPPRPAATRLIDGTLEPLDSLHVTRV